LLFKKKDKIKNESAFSLYVKWRKNFMGFFPLKCTGSDFLCPTLFFSRGSTEQKKKRQRGKTLLHNLDDFQKEKRAHVYESHKMFLDGWSINFQRLKANGFFL
jgi:hypothetical protein